MKHLLGRLSVHVATSWLSACAVVVIQCRGGIPGAADWDIDVDKVSLLAFLLDLKSCLNLRNFFLHTTRLYKLLVSCSSTIKASN